MNKIDWSIVLVFVLTSAAVYGMLRLLGWS